MLGGKMPLKNTCRIIMFIGIVSTAVTAAKNPVIFQVSPPIGRTLQVSEFHSNTQRDRFGSKGLGSAVQASRVVV